MEVLRRLSDVLMSPARGLSDPVERGAARLLAACLLGIVLVFIGLDAILIEMRPNYSPPWEGYGVIAVAYALSRSRRYRWGAVLTTTMFPAVALSMVFAGDPQGIRALSYALLAPFFAGLFLGVRGAATFAIVTPLLIGVVPALAGVPLNVFVDDLAATVMGALVAVSYAFHRDWVEGRRRELNARHEAELLQMQKMEAIGRLAGGIAHDFNNLLTVISGGVELLGRHGDRKELKLIEAATRSAQDLTERLLTLSRQQVVGHASTDIRTVLEGTEQLLARIIGEDIELSVETTPDVDSVGLAEGQLQQVLLNLATNARDAMPQGGSLRFSARNESEQFVLLRVKDTGVGMNSEVREKVFEPFFTTKSVGEGTGLGLAMVFGLVNQSGGAIEVDSAEGRGTEFRLLLPRAPADLDEPPAMSDRRLTLGGTARGRILLVEDDASVREVCRSVLRREGYEVAEAAGPGEALEVIVQEEHKFDLLISDIVMPGGSGVELAEEIRRSDPELPVLFMSGYAPEDVVGQELSPRDLLQKPFRPTDLLRRVSALLYGLDSQSPPASGHEIEAPIPPAAQLPRTITLPEATPSMDPPVSAPRHSEARRRLAQESEGMHAERKKTSGDE